MDWQSVATAPKDGTVIRLRGKRQHSNSDEVITVIGHYDRGGFTEGWEDDNSNWFIPTEWKLYKKDDKND